MKLKSWFWTLGWKPKTQVYGTTRLSFTLPKEGTVEFEKWQHPKDYFQPFNQSLVDQLKQYIRPGDSVIDIGAHCGDFSVPLALAAGPRGVVFAWEPNPYVYAVLEKNAALNRNKTNIVPVHAAVASSDSEQIFHYSDPGFCNGGSFDGISRWRHGHAFRLSVPGKRLNDWMSRYHPERLSRVSFVKVDTEGFDLEVLQSIQPILLRQRPSLHVEFYRHSSRERRAALWSFLDTLGYDVFKTEDGYGVQPISHVAEGDVMRWEHFDAIALPRQAQSAAA